MLLSSPGSEANTESASARCASIGTGRREAPLQANQCLLFYAYSVPLPTVPGVGGVCDFAENTGPRHGEVM